MSIYNLELVKDKRYRITIADVYSEYNGKRYFIEKGKKFRAIYKGTINNFLSKVTKKEYKGLMFETTKFYESTGILERMTTIYQASKTESTIVKIEEVEEISIDDQARQKGRWDEYMDYQTINGKTPRRQFIYTEVK